MGGKAACGSAHSFSVIGDLGGKAKLTRQVAIHVGQLEANQHRAYDGGIGAVAQKFEECVARKKALGKQLGKEEVACGAAGGAEKQKTRHQSCQCQE